MNPKEALRGARLFAELSDAEIDEVVDIITERQVRTGESLIREGDEGESLFILEEGSVDVIRNGEKGQSARITELGQGAMFGEMAFVDPEAGRGGAGHSHRTAGIVAHGRAKVLELRYDRLAALAERDPVLGVKLYRALAVSLNGKLKNTTDHLLPLIASSRLAALGQMTANIAHELGNPLSVLRSLSEQLSEQVGRDGTGGAEAASWADKIASTVIRIGKVITGLRTACRDGTGDPLVEADPGTIVGETLEFCEQRLRYFGIQVDWQRGAPGRLVRCRPVQVSQAVLNLLNNAMDALASMPEGAERRIRVGVTESGGFLSISVEDSGVGVPGEVETKIFRPFFTTKGLGVGTGLGLSISRQLIESNGGQLLLENRARPTRFVIRLPLADPKGI